MTKGFDYSKDKEQWTIDDMKKYFEENEAAFGYLFFNSWLRYSFKVVCRANGIRNVSAVTHDGVADFSIWWDDGIARPAGTESVTCASELINEFLNRIHCPENYKFNGLP